MYTHWGLSVMNFLQVHTAFQFYSLKRKRIFCHTRYVLVNGSLARSLSSLFGRTAFGSPLLIGFPSSRTYRTCSTLLRIWFCVLRPRVQSRILSLMRLSHRLMLSFKIFSGDASRFTSKQKTVISEMLHHFLMMCNETCSETLNYASNWRGFSSRKDITAPTASVV